MCGSNVTMRISRSVCRMYVSRLSTQRCAAPQYENTSCSPPRLGSSSPMSMVSPRWWLIAPSSRFAITLPHGHPTMTSVILPSPIRSALYMVRSSRAIGVWVCGFPAIQTAPQVVSYAGRPATITGLFHATDPVAITPASAAAATATPETARRWKRPSLSFTRGTDSSSVAGPTARHANTTPACTNFSL